MFKLPAKPSAGADVHELADLTELFAMSKGTASAREVLAFLGRESENDGNLGCEDDDSRNSDAFDDVVDEFGYRLAACGGRYPFSLDSAGNVLRYIASDEPSATLYSYLLLSTRLNMATSRNQAGIDGTTLLEEVSASGLQQYLGLPRAQAVVFGTASESANFPSRVAALCSQLGEGYGFKDHFGGAGNAKDDKLDAVAWLPFADSKGSMVIIFGQCKTGTAWSERLCHLQPESFIKKWMETGFLLNPLRAYCVSESIRRSRWSQSGIDGGLLFDRCRLVECCEQIESALLRKIKRWNSAALTTAKAVL